MPVTSNTRNRVVAVPARYQRYNTLDKKIKGLGLRVTPQGRKIWFLQVMHNGKRHYRTLGEMPAMSEIAAREAARDLLARIHAGEDVPVANDGLTFAEVAEEVFRRHGRRWKPRTMRVNRDYLKSCLLPVFGAMPIAAIGAADVQAWFAGLRGRPGAANRSAPILSVILDRAMAYGYLPEGPNPCAGIRRYRRPPSERFLSVDEMALLGRLLRDAEARFPAQVAIVRLIALTGARKSEIMTLEWGWYRDDGSGARQLHLPDSKTGPRTIFLGDAARAILDAQQRPKSRPKTGCGRWVFPASRRAGPIPCINSFWKRLRAGTAIADVRLHDLRHSYASIALRHGCTIRVIGRLLGHADPATTLKYTHLEDAQIRAAADVVSAGLSGGGEVMPCAAA